MTNNITNFLKELHKIKDFQGESSQTQSQRTVYATDNSIYELKPHAIIWPKTINDLQKIMALSQEEKYQNIPLTARGGGTGTNGQSLNTGIIIDLSRHMNQILEIDPKNRRARVQTGVVKDQLNAALKPYGLFFAPELSTSNRATIGGMINTDACGQGSLRYGKTHDHVLSLRSVLIGGEILDSAPLKREHWQENIQNKSAQQQKLYHALYKLATEKKALIQESFPPLTRALTGYDLPHLLDEEYFNINSLLCGSEGSLALIAEAELNLLPIPKYRALINIGYNDFQSALKDANALMFIKPLSIETIDSKVLKLAQDDLIWQSVAEYFPENVAGINLLELDSEDETTLKQQIESTLNHLKNDKSVQRLSITTAWGAKEIEKIYHMRKRAVGLLGNVQGEKRPLPFVEDTAVPPEHLADFILEFRQILDQAGLEYGMFGHVDAGVLHVRPQLDLKENSAKTNIQKITDQIAALTHRYGGVLWGEHGKGLRSEYAPKFFGKCWESICEVKRLFDPKNQLNPGKIAIPNPVKYQLTPLLSTPLRGDYDKNIPKDNWQSYGNTLYCNGNGACFNYDYNDPMCPSWKITRDRRHSPKGRAMLIKEWLRQKSSQDLDPKFEKEVYEVLHGCLSCKSCAGQCPVKVDIPDSKSQFLAEYHSRHRRPIRDYLIGYLENFIPALSHIAPLYNFLQKQKITRKINEKILRLSDAPLFHPQAKENSKRYGAILLKKNTPAPKYEKNSVFIIQDAFTRYFDSQVFFDFLKLLQKLNIKTYILPYFPNGKPLHVHGFLKSFNKRRLKNERLLRHYQQSALPMIGLDPAMTLVYRQEYQKHREDKINYHIQLPQEWLKQILPQYPAQATKNITYYLAEHCTEKTQASQSGKEWQQIFKHFGLELSIIPVGCCGMAGTYGHETEHQNESKALFAHSWQKALEQYGDKLLSTGYSCRSQSKRFAKQTLKHPLQILLQHLL